MILTFRWLYNNENIILIFNKSKGFAFSDQIAFSKIYSMWLEKRCNNPWTSEYTAIILHGWLSHAWRSVILYTCIVQFDSKCFAGLFLDQPQRGIRQDLPVSVKDWMSYVRSMLTLSAFSTFLKMIPMNHMETKSFLLQKHTRSKIKEELAQFI